MNFFNDLGIFLACIGGTILIRFTYKVVWTVHYRFKLAQANQVYIEKLKTLTAQQKKYIQSIETELNEMRQLLFHKNDKDIEDLLTEIENKYGGSKDG